MAIVMIDGKGCGNAIRTFNQFLLLFGTVSSLKENYGGIVLEKC